MIVLQVVLAAVIFVYQDEVRNAVDKGLREVFDRQDTNRDAIDGIQTAVSIFLFNFCFMKGKFYNKVFYIARMLWR